MRLLRFSHKELTNRLGLVVEGGGGKAEQVIDLTSLDAAIFSDVITAYEYAKGQNQSLSSLIREKAASHEPSAFLEEVLLHTPVESAEVWAAGVTYERSRVARNVETKISDSVYDRVYEADRPELFFKSTAVRTTDPGRELGIRSDSEWMIPEPELALVLSGDGDIVGYTIGNDMSSRDIEGENPLYLPQAKVFKGACSFGPTLLLAETAENPYAFTIQLRIYRGDALVVEDQTSTQSMKRKFEELVHYLQKDNWVFPGTTLFTGTGIVPRDDFSLAIGDRIEIEVPGIGVLSNRIGIIE